MCWDSVDRFIINMTSFSVIIGDGACGKTCFLYRFCENKFSVEYIPTIFENYNKEYEFDGKKRILR